MRSRRRTENISVRLSGDQAAHLRRWADADPYERGMGEVLRRLIDEEVIRERQRYEAADRARGA